MGESGCDDLRKGGAQGAGGIRGARGVDLELCAVALDQVAEFMNDSAVLRRQQQQQQSE